MGVKIANKCIYNTSLYKRATFWKAKTVCYTHVAVLSRVSQKICLVENLLSVRFITKLLSKEDLSILCLAYFSRFIKHKYMYVLCLMGIIYIFYLFYLDSLVNLSINWPINTLLIENLAFGKYEVAVLRRVISILGMILLAAGWFIEVIVLFQRQYIK